MMMIMQILTLSLKVHKNLLEVCEEFIYSSAFYAPDGGGIILCLRVYMLWPTVHPSQHLNRISRGCLEGMS